MTQTPLLEVKDLSIGYRSDGALLQALRHVNLTAHAGEVIGIVGESGCGKSTLASALINLISPNAVIGSGGVHYRGADILTLPEAEKRRIRGRDIAMVFQDPMTALNPVITLGEQLIDYQYHLADLSRAQKRERAAAMLARVGIPDPELCQGRYVHELSGGMRQRAAIAAALLMTPSVLIADEPTTALDVTMEAQIIHLLRELRHEHQGSIIVVTHHLGVIGELCDRVYVMYAGQVVEEGLVDEIYHSPRHPYTAALIACDPAHLPLEEEGASALLPTIPGRLPDLAHPPQGCGFADRCQHATETCRQVPPPWVVVSDTQAALCHRVQP